MDKNRLFFLFIIGCLVITGCGGGWAYTVDSTFHDDFSIKAKMLGEYAELEDADSSCDKGIPLEIALYQNGIRVIESAEIVAKDGQSFALDDQDFIQPICANEDGTLTFGDEVITPVTVRIQEKEESRGEQQIQDVTATVSSVLGLDMDNLAGVPLTGQIYKHVVLIFLDGVGYHTYLKSLGLGLIPNISSDAEILSAVTVYPPRTSTSSAALMTGLMPNDSGVFKSGIRSTEAPTMFDRAAEKGLSSIAIEGEALAFNMRNTQAILSGDRDQNGSTDDNTFQNAMEALENGVPQLTWIHFHGIDDRGHAYGPNTDEVLEKVAEVDGYVGQIIEILPSDTLIIIFADHGMHSIQEEDELGNHGNLIHADMVIPIIIKTK